MLASHEEPADHQYPRHNSARRPRAQLTIDLLLSLTSSHLLGRLDRRVGAPSKPRWTCHVVLLLNFAGCRMLVKRPSHDYEQ